MIASALSVFRDDVTRHEVGEACIVADTRMKVGTR
jgi:hypothetical protein